jgi:hypothetical protein
MSKVRFFKVCWILKWPFSHFFPISDLGREKFGKFPSEKSDSGKFHAKFCRNRLYLYDVQKTAKKRRFSGNSGFRILTTFRKFSDLYRFYTNFTCVPAAQMFLWKHRKCTNFSEFRFGNGEIFPISPVFFSDVLFPEFPNFGNRTKFLRNLHSAHCLKWHITLRFSEKPENPGISRDISVTSSREKFRENVEVCVTGT